MKTFGNFTVTQTGTKTVAQGMAHVKEKQTNRLQRSVLVRKSPKPFERHVVIFEMIC